MPDESNWGASAWMAAGGAPDSMRYSVGGVSIPSTMAKARSEFVAVDFKCTVDLSGSETELPFHVPSAARVSAVRRPDTSSRYLTQTFDWLADTSSTARWAL